MTIIKNTGVSKVINTMIKDCKVDDFYRKDIKIRNKNLLQNVLDFLVKENFITFKKVKGVRVYSWISLLKDIDYSSLVEKINLEFPVKDYKEKDEEECFDLFEEEDLNVFDEILYDDDLLFDENNEITCDQFLKELREIKQCKELYLHKEKKFIDKHKEMIEALSLEV